MLERISITCFAASYGVALGLEISRLIFHSAWRNVLLWIFALAGLIAHTLYLGYRGYEAVLTHHTPLSSSAEYYLLAAWVLGVMYLLTLALQPRARSGIFFLPLVLLLIATSRFADGQPFPQERAASIWFTLHTLLLLLGYVVVVFGFAMGIMYLLQAARLKAKQPPTARFRLPNLEWLELANQRSVVGAAILIILGIVAGVIFNLVQQGIIPWHDPVIWRSAIITGWLICALLFCALYRPAQRGRKVAYLTIASFLFLMVSVLLGLVFKSEHKAPQPLVNRVRIEAVNRGMAACRRCAGEACA
ncbi:MAG: cytochrome c biogenesis protein CcsA [Pirellulales bacterium]|nr:cytochrome c biogenesis protein CcsA [Pirellulales bacterium]